MISQSIGEYVIVSDDGQGYPGKIKDRIRDGNGEMWYQVNFEQWREDCSGVDGEEESEHRPRV